MGEKADKGSAFLFPLFPIPIQASSVPNYSKKGEKFLIFFGGINR